MVAPTIIHGHARFPHAAALLRDDPYSGVKKSPGSLLLLLPMISGVCEENTMRFIFSDSQPFRPGARLIIPEDVNITVIGHSSRISPWV